FEIMRAGPLGAAAFNNEFGRPCLGGYFRAFEQETGEPGVRRGYDKPMLIGLGGGAASSMAGGASSAQLDFASVQRDNAEMQRRCQEVIDACTALGERNP